jgi:hypothetical protein
MRISPIEYGNAGGMKELVVPVSPINSPPDIVQPTELVNQPFELAPKTIPLILRELKD